MPASPFNFQRDYEQAYNTFQDLADTYNQALDKYNQDVEAWNNYYYNPESYPQVSRPSETFDMPRPEEPARPREPTDTQTLGEVLPQELYASVFGRGTPDTLTNEAWSLQNISTPFLSSTPDTAYDLGQVNRMNNPLYYASPNLLTEGQQATSANQSMATQNPYY